jgi:hypothetical protein
VTRRGRRFSRFVVGAVVLLAAGCARHHTASLPDPAAARRFAIRLVADSTFDFLTDGAKWVRPGAEGIAVDPRQRDLLVARFFVTRVNGDTAVALVTGQTTRVADVHVALLAPPHPGPVHRPSFWAGFFGGAVLGAVIAIIAR